MSCLPNSNVQKKSVDQMPFSEVAVFDFVFSVRQQAFPPDCVRSQHSFLTSFPNYIVLTSSSDFLFFGLAKVSFDAAQKQPSKVSWTSSLRRGWGLLEGSTSQRQQILHRSHSFRPQPSAADWSLSVSDPLLCSFRLTGAYTHRTFLAVFRR